MRIADLAAIAIERPERFDPLTRNLAVAISGWTEWKLMRSPELPVFVPELGNEMIGFLHSPHCDRDGRVCANLHFGPEFGLMIATIARASRAGRLKPVETEQTAPVQARKPGVWSVLKSIWALGHHLAEQQQGAAR